MKRKAMSLILTLALILGLIPGVKLSVKAESDTVRVIVENTTFTEEEEYDDVPWEGTLIDTTVELTSDDTMFSCIQKAVEGAGYTMTASGDYITEINGLEAGAADMFGMDGWVGTLNGWFPDAGFGSFGVANGELTADDVIKVMYTCTLSDVGMVWSPSQIDFSLSALSTSAGTLSPAFDKDVKSYTLVVPGECTGITVNAVSADPNVRPTVSVGETVYKKTETIPVKTGTVIKASLLWTEWSSDYTTSTVITKNEYTINVVRDLPSYQLSDIGAQWANFRNSTANMAITSAQTPVDKAHTKLKWATEKLSTGAYNSNPPGQQLIVGNALIFTAGNSIYKYDLATGARLASGTLPGSQNYGYTALTYVPEKGILYVPLDGGKIAAVDPSTLNVLWTYVDELGGQAQSPLTYNDGFIYGGFWTGEAKAANFVCVNAATGEMYWTYTVQGGFYWAGAAAVGNYVVVGTDDGASGTNGTSHVYVFSKESNTPVSSLELTGMGDQRSCMAVSDGRVYFTTKKGYLCSAAIDAATGALSDLKVVNYGAQSTSTPVVYGDYVYFATGSGISETGSSGNMVIAKKDDLSKVKAIGLKGYPQASLLLSTAYEASEGYLYFYSTYNAQPGGVSLIKVKASDPTDTVLEEIYDAAGHEQFCISSVICDANGDLYYKNDSGCVLALTKTTVAVPQIIVDLSTEEVKYQQNDAAAPLTVAATTPDEGELTYQWQYSINGSDFTDIPEGTNSSFTPYTSLLTTYKYRCVVTNTLNGQSETAVSKTATVIVKVFSQDAGLKVVTSTSNNVASGTQVIAASGSTYKFENYAYSKRVWLGTNEPNATITSVELLTYTDTNATFTAVTSSNVYNGETYKYRFFKSNYTGTSTFKVTVLAEDGVTEAVHYVVLTSDAEYVPASSDITVTIENAGNVVVPMKTVTVKDLDYDGLFTVNEALYAAHEAFYEGGAAAGYACGTTQYGLSLFKLWGDESGAFGYYLDNNSCWSLADPVTAGQYLYAYIYADQIYWSDSYAAFEDTAYNCDTKRPVTVTLNASGYDANWNPVTAPKAGAVIQAYDENMQTALPASEFSFKDNGDGTYTLYFTKAGTYLVAASTADKSITPALTAVTVAEGPADYVFTAGMNQRVAADKDAQFVTDGDLDEFIELLLDGKVVDPKNYTLKKGSTYITLKADFVKTLKAGEHTLTAVYETSTCSTTFIVEEAKKEPAKQETEKKDTDKKEDSKTQILGVETASTHPYFFAVMAMVLLIMACAVALACKKKDEQ